MSDELFVDGICEIDDKTIESYFSQYGSRIKHYDSHRHRQTNSCCFALISFESFHTINSILRHRPHIINNYKLFVKRLLPPDSCSFIERLLPVTSLFVYKKNSKEYSEEKLKNYFNTFGKILKFEYNHSRNRLFIEYDDYDSVDRIFLNKDHLPNYIDIHKNILPHAQNTIEYHGTCRRKQENIHHDEKKKKKSHRKKSHLDEQYQDLLQKTIADLIDCKGQLRSKENDFIVLQMEYTKIKEENNKLNEFIQEQNQTINSSCFLCQEYETTINRLQQTLFKINEQYQRLILTQQSSKPKSDISTITPVRCPKYSLSTRLKNDENYKYEAFESSLSHSTISTSGCSDIIPKQQHTLFPKIQSRLQPHQTI